MLVSVKAFWKNENRKTLGVSFLKSIFSFALRASVHVRMCVHVLFFVLFFLGILFLSSCDGTDAGGILGGETTGDPYTPTEVLLSPTGAAGEWSIDTSTVSAGYVGASAVSGSRLKFQVAYGEMSYNYDLPSDGLPIVCPINMGNGVYSFSIWENTSDNRYVQLGSTETIDVALESEFVPFLRPSYFCPYSESSACVQKAFELSAEAENEGDVLKNIYNYVTDNVDYDDAKAATVEEGYIPNPDSTFQSNTGICFDYASLAAAMLRSQGIPCKIMTGYVSPDNIYHAWNMVYINGSWSTITFVVESNTWTRIDTTFAAGGATNFVGDGTNYTDRYTY